MDKPPILEQSRVAGGGLEGTDWSAAHTGLRALKETGRGWLM